MSRKKSNIDELSIFDEDGALNVIIETPKGSRNKYTFDEQKKLFTLGGILPVGASFPFDFGFIPNTLGGDGDPLDVLVLMDEAAFPGCLVAARLVGVIEAEQTERDGKTERNDRLVAVARESLIYADVNQIKNLNESLVEQIKHFFISYNEIKGKKFVPLGEFGSRKAKNLVEEGAKLYGEKTKKIKITGEKSAYVRDVGESRL